MTLNDSNSVVNKDIFPFHRAGGILLHPTSLPGSGGIGDLGNSAFKFIDFLHSKNQRLWQVLPLGPTGYGESPYSCLSAFAGNPYIISFERLEELNLLDKSSYIPDQPFNKQRVEYGKVIPYKWDILKKSYSNYFKNPNKELETEFQKFIDIHAKWLDDFALFMALKMDNDQKSWITWPEPYRKREPDALKEWSEKYEREINFYKFIQYLFFKQWDEVKEYANKKKILIIGDVPIYVALDSSDVWANQNLFYLDNETGNPIYIAGVPPDHFSKTGQRWGNPIYRWEIVKQTNYQWWVERIKHALTKMDIIRIDHFRGFVEYWEIPGENPTAETGRWVPGPGKELFSELKKQLKVLPIIAEDLSYYLTPDVHDLRKLFNFPGMRILQYAFAERWGTGNRYFPHNYESNTVAYTGSHDNNTSVGWFDSLKPAIKQNVLEYLGCSDDEIISNLIQYVWASVAKIALVPLQDILRLDNSARMNFPGHPEASNWEWRFTWEELKEKSDYCNELAILSQIYERC
ncbi:MAG: 4-alpha-glucanotransferase [Candidatus Hodarchaeales archaeon]